jgi:serine/threonine protein kinase
MIGKVIDGKYRIDERIGQGGFGKVYRGSDLNLKRDVAIKILTDIGYEEDFKRRFLRESEMMAKLMHPNIVTVFDFGEFEGRPYLVLELVDGPSLMAMAQKTPISAGQVITLAGQVCEAMAYAHGQGIIHRDLSLRNIMVSDRDQVRILDFGLAKLMSATGQTSADLMGTPYYVSPEGITGGDIDERVDIFAFGVGLFRLLTGHFPFEAEHPASVLYQIVNERDIKFAGDMPPELKDIILKCLEKDPDDRYRDFTELGEAFKRLEDRSLDSSVTIPSEVVTRVKRGKRNPYLNRVMLKNPDDFFGRDREVKRIYSRLDAPHPQSISVVGERRIGKSSLLNYIYQRKNRKRFMQNHNNSIFIFMDFQRSADLTIPKFIDILFSMFRYEEAKEIGGIDGERSLDQLKDVIQKLSEQGKRIIVLMDEFEAITKNENFNMPFFSFLRFLANNFMVAYVTSSYMELQQMCHNKDIADSPFFNIFSNLPLRPFSRDEAVELVTVPSEREGVPLGRYTDQVLELSGCFPLYVQVACSNLFEFFIENPEAEPDWKEISRLFKEEVYPHYSFIWGRMDDASKQSLCRIATGRNIGKKHKFVSEDLLRRGFLREENGNLAVFASSFKDFVLEQSQRIAEKKKSFFSSFWGKKGKRTD